MVPPGPASARGPISGSKFITRSRHAGPFCRHALSGHQVMTAHEMGRADFANGDLLSAGEAQQFGQAGALRRELRGHPRRT